MNDVTVGVAGATGALGKEILAVLDEAPWRPRKVVALAGPTTAVSHVDYGEERLPVDDLADQAFDELDALIVALPAEHARQVAGQAADDGVLVVDCAGVFTDDPDVPLWVPWVNPERLPQAVEGGLVSLPDPASTLLASVLGPLARAGLRGEVTATVMRPASAWGRDGMDELSKQVVALFNSGTPPRKVFSSGLAFDLLPQDGVVVEGGSTAIEARVRAEVADLTGFQDISITSVGVPVFTGISATIQVRTSRSIPEGLLEQLFGDAGLKLPKEAGPRYQPRPRRVDGSPFVHVGRIRVNAQGHLEVFASLDNLRGSAAAAVAAVGAMLQGRRDA